MSPAQQWALTAIAAGEGISPATLGYAMTERPGYTGKPGCSLKAQGAGRMDGTMMDRLRKLGLVTLTSSSRGEWHPTRATLTHKGAQVVAVAHPDCCHPPRK